MSTKTFRSQVRDLSDSAPELGKRAGKRIQQGVDRAPELGKRAVHEAQERAPKLLNAAKAAAVAALPAMTAAVQNRKVRRGLRGLIRTNPVASVIVGAVGVGVAIFAFTHHGDDDVDMFEN